MIKYFEVCDILKIHNKVLELSGGLEGYNDGNKRTSMLLANKILISNGKGILNVPIELDIKFGELLINYYETNDMEKIKRFFYDNCLDGIN